MLLISVEFVQGRLVFIGCGPSVDHREGIMAAPKSVVFTGMHFQKTTLKLGISEYRAPFKHWFDALPKRKLLSPIY